jgi:hypothetical protein
LFEHNASALGDPLQRAARPGGDVVISWMWLDIFAYRLFACEPAGCAGARDIK